MSLEAMTWAFKQTLNPTRKIVLLALADYADDENRCWPSMRTLAEKSSLTERAVRNAIRDLEEIGYLTTESRNRPNGSQTSNVYWLNVPGGAERRSGAPSPETTPPEPSSNPQENTPPTPSDDERAFEAIWTAWPNKSGKKAGAAAWRKMSGSAKRAHIPAIVAHANAYRQNTPPRYIPMLSTFLNGERWSDPLAVDGTRGTRNPEPTRPQAFNIPAGHVAIRDDITGAIIGTEPA